MEAKVEILKASDVSDGFSGISLGDTTQTILLNLNMAERDRYGRAIGKVEQGRILNRRDVVVLDKIDSITYKHYGMCLKDSLVTKARLKACKKYGIPFIDRDGLIKHMNLMTQSEKRSGDLETFYSILWEIFVEKMGNSAPKKLKIILNKLDNKQDLDLTDLTFLSEMEQIASSELDWTIVNQELKDAISSSTKRLGIYFQNLQNVIVH